MKLLAGAALATLALSACATAPDPGPGDIADPYEGFNRRMFAFNNGVDKYALAPAANVYKAVTPEFARDRVSDFLGNLRSPVTFANDVLQAEPSRAGTTLARFGINTTVGLLGLWDAAEHMGIDGHREDFGQTLAVWGVGNGPYLVLPIFGPSTARDATGMLVDSYADPIRLYLFNTDQEEWHYARIASSVVDQREELLDIIDDLRRNSFDYYAALRSAYIQRRVALVNDQDPDSTSSPAIPDYDY